MKKLIILIITIIMTLPITTGAAVYEVDPAHTNFGFSAEHMVITKVRGTFQKYEGTLELDDNNKLTGASAVIDVNSIYTKIEKRDNHLRSADFFDVAKYQDIKFKTTSINYSGPGKLSIIGDITIRDVTKEIPLTGEILGPVKDPWGQTRIGFNFTSSLNRKDFGLMWNKVLESGGVLVGDIIELLIEGEGILKQ